MELGIADFTSLQSRNIAVGFLFLIYAVLWAAPLWMIGQFVFLFARFAKKHEVAGLKYLAYFAAFFLVGVISAMPFAALASFAIAFFHTTGPSIDLESASIAHYFQHSFVKLPILLAGMMVLVGILFLPMYYATVTDITKLKSSNKSQLSHYLVVQNDIEIDDNILLIRIQRSLIVIACFVAAVTVLPTVLYGYANEVYPNLRYNLGGGQPQIAELILGGKRSEVSSFSGKTLCCDSAVAKSDDMALQLNDVAIWYQSDKFLYVMELPESKPAHEWSPQLLAVDIKLVRAVRYLRKRVTVSSGGRIENVETY